MLTDYSGNAMVCVLLKCKRFQTNLQLVTNSWNIDIMQFFKSYNN